MCETVELCNNRRRILTRVPDKPYPVVTPMAERLRPKLYVFLLSSTLFFGWNEARTADECIHTMSYYMVHRTQ